MEHALVAMESKTRRVNGFEVLGLTEASEWGLGPSCPG
jgi:hypothetical protein